MKKDQQKGIRVYFMFCQNNGYFIKIGLAANPYKRRLDLQTGCPHPIYKILSLDGNLPMQKARKIETLFHKILKNNQVSGEWFYFNDMEILQDMFKNIVTPVVEAFDLNWHFHDV